MKRKNNELFQHKQANRNICTHTHTCIHTYSYILGINLLTQLKGIKETYTDTNWQNNYNARVHDLITNN